MLKFALAVAAIFQFGSIASAQVSSVDNGEITVSTPYTFNCNPEGKEGPVIRTHFGVDSQVGRIVGGHVSNSEIGNCQATNVDGVLGRSMIIGFQAEGVGCKSKAGVYASIDMRGRSGNYVVDGVTWVCSSVVKP